MVFSHRLILARIKQFAPGPDSVRGVIHHLLVGLLLAVSHRVPRVGHRGAGIDTVCDRAILLVRCHDIAPTPGPWIWTSLPMATTPGRSVGKPGAPSDWWTVGKRCTL